MLRERFPAVFTLLYYGIAAGFFQLAVVLAKRSSAVEVFREGGFAETVQLACTAIAAVLLFVLGLRFPAQAGSLMLFAALCFLAAIRELNNTQLYQAVFAHRGASWIFGVVLLGTVIVKYRRFLKAHVLDVLRQPATHIFCAAFAIIVVWAQVLAQKAIFRDRETDRIVEEALESAGYVLLLCGVIELFFNLRSQQQLASPSRAEDKRAILP